MQTSSSPVENTIPPSSRDGPWLSGNSVITAVKNAPPSAMKNPASRPRTIRRCGGSVDFAVDHSTSRCAVWLGVRSPGMTRVAQASVDSIALAPERRTDDRPRSYRSWDAGAVMLFTGANEFLVERYTRDTFALRRALRASRRAHTCSPRYQPRRSDNDAQPDPCSAARARSVVLRHVGVALCHAPSRDGEEQDRPGSQPHVRTVQRAASRRRAVEGRQLQSPDGAADAVLCGGADVG